MANFLTAYREKRQRNRFSADMMGKEFDILKKKKRKTLVFTTDLQHDLGELPGLET